MLSEVEIRAIAQRIVDKAKRTAHVKDGTLKRSIRYTVRRGVYEFREMFYGQWNNNSQLEKLAAEMMPYGTEWKIIYIDKDGGIYEVGRTRAGRKTQRSSLISLVTSGTSKIKELIRRTRGKEKK